LGGANGAGIVKVDSLPMNRLLCVFCPGVEAKVEDCPAAGVPTHLDACK
jgi:hypothetical protein